MKNIYLLAALVASSQSAPVLAGQWGIGINIGSTSTDVVSEACDSIKQPFTLTSPANSFSCANNDGDTALNIYVDYKFNDIWGAELGYIDLGQYDTMLSVDDSAVFRQTGTSDLPLFSYDVKAAYLAGTGTWNFGNKWSLLGRIGVAKFDLDIDVAASFLTADIEDSESIAMGGAELGYSFNDHWSMNLRYDHFDTDAIDGVVSLGAHFNF
mgnify:CR=1 FL=1